MSQSDKKTNILITGGLGNLGSWLTNHFCDQGYNVYVMASRKRNILQDLPFTFLQCDITDKAACQALFEENQFHIIIHTASANEFYLDGYDKTALEVNALGTRNLLEAAKDHKPLQHFVYFSTFQVYGLRSGPVFEHTPAEPGNDYGATHLFAEYYVKQFHKNYGLPYTIFRLTNSYGAPKDPDSSKWYLVLNDLSRMAFQSKEIVLKSNGEACRDFIWMGDVCSIVQKVVEKAPTNDIYNISGEKAVQVLQVAKYVQQAYKEAYGIELPVKKNEEDTKAHPQDLVVSSAKLKSLIHFDLNEKFTEEAKNIFRLLENHNQ